jgi:hypothetical protein
MTERPGVHTGTTFQDGRTIWPLDTAELLILDDADGGIPDLEIDPDRIQKALLDQLTPDFFAVMKQRRTLWVAGTNDRAPIWQALVAALLTDNDPAEVGAVALSADLIGALKQGPFTVVLHPFRRNRIRARPAPAGAS